MLKPSAFAHSGFAGVIGVARKDITPPLGIYARNWGAAKHDRAEGIHRPLTLSALTLQQETSAPPLVLIAADLGWWREASCECAVREALLNALELDPARLIFHLSHTHAGPVLSATCAGMPGGHLIEPYLQSVREAALAATREALACALPAALEWTTGRCDLAQNRDLRDPAKPRIVCGYNPGAPADDTLLVGRVTCSNGRVMATLVNYACHPVTLAWDNRLISPDYVGALREIVEVRTEAPCLFLQGASGELAPAEEYVGDISVADAHGRRLGYAVLSALEGMLPTQTELTFEGVVESGAPLAIWSRRSRAVSRTLAAQAPVAALAIKKEYALTAEIEHQLAACSDHVTGERLRRKLAVRKSLGDGTHATFRQWVWRVGDTFVVGVPNEAYSHLQLELRRRFAGHAVAVMNIANGCTGYLPPADLYAEDLYQVWQSPFEAGGLEQVLEACAAGIEALARVEC